MQQTINDHDYQRAKMSYRSDRMAEIYDATRFLTRRGRSLNQRFLKALINIFNVLKENGHPLNSVLDIPCGTGRIFPSLLTQNIHLIGADISIEMMLRFRQKTKSPDQVPLIQCDAAKMPFKDMSFDVIICLRFLTTRVSQHARYSIFKEVNRVSRAWVIIECRHKTYLSLFRYLIFQKILDRTPKLYYFSLKSIKQKLNAAGIKLVRIFYPYGLFSNKWLLLGRVDHNPIF